MRWFWSGVVLLVLVGCTGPDGQIPRDDGVRPEQASGVSVSGSAIIGYVKGQ
ncbi:hypothetical protein ROLI_007650 [Roseobacter fucihabitans]|uniref:Argininosuccinate lyase n=1 Tax=Roseobacter fucihabitans TaxID=1537242 RepID=A0ABZ2BS62_9RHOB|nr:hypothetical protein [Roseobacter litoralis]